MGPITILEQRRKAIRDRRILTVLLAGALIFTLLNTAQAETQCEDLSLGLGPGAIPDYEGSDKYKAVPLPYLNVRWSNHMSIQWFGKNAQVNLIPSPTWLGGPALEFIPERDDNWVDDRQIGKLDSVDHSLMAGGFFGFQVGDWVFNIEVMHDIADGNDGAIARLNSIYKVPFSDTLRMTIGVFTTYADDDYMDAYFGVSQRESERSGIKTYDAESGLKDVGGTVSVFY